MAVAVAVSFWVKISEGKITGIAWESMKVGQSHQVGYY